MKYKESLNPIDTYIYTCTTHYLGLGLHIGATFKKERNYISVAILRRYHERSNFALPETKRKTCLTYTFR